MNDKIKDLEKKLAKQSELLAKAVEVIKFYADENNWLSVQVGYGDKVMMHRCDLTDFKNDHEINRCGKRAIEFLKEIGG